MVNAKPLWRPGEDRPRKSPYSGFTTLLQAIMAHVPVMRETFVRSPPCCRGTSAAARAFRAAAFEPFSPPSRRIGNGPPASGGQRDARGTRLPDLAPVSNCGEARGGHRIRSARALGSGDGAGRPDRPRLALSAALCRQMRRRNAARLRPAQGAVLHQGAMSAALTGRSAARLTPISAESARNSRLSPAAR
jgi:hypothetical protein